MFILKAVSHSKGGWGVAGGWTYLSWRWARGTGRGTGSCKEARSSGMAHIPDLSITSIQEKWTDKEYGTTNFDRMSKDNT